jgi:3-hydroxy-3-methylglutaryl CoA synthase
MIEEMKALPGPDGTGSLLEAVDVMVPHQANKVMVNDIAKAVGFPLEQIYFNIERTGNVSAASIPLAIYDSVLDKAITEPSRIFCPGFGAGAVAGYAVLHLDPSIVVGPEVIAESSAGGELGYAVEDDHHAFFA